MPLAPLIDFCPETAERETRSISILQPSGNPRDLPPGTYDFLEFYCNEPDCDCRRVLLVVVSEKGKPLASISYGFDEDDPMKGPFLDPLGYRSPYANAALEAAEQYLFSDPNYVARLERHYALAKEVQGAAVSTPRRSEPAANATSRIEAKRQVRKQQQAWLRKRETLSKKKRR